MRTADPGGRIQPLARASPHRDCGPWRKEPGCAVGLFSVDKGLSSVEAHNWDVHFKKPGSSNPAAP